MSVKRKPRKTGRKKKLATLGVGNGTATEFPVAANGNGAKAFSIKLDDDVREVLGQLGGGNISEGVRRAADIAKRLNY
jgi:hypothetical protein